MVVVVVTASHVSGVDEWSHRFTSLSWLVLFLRKLIPDGGSVSLPVGVCSIKKGKSCSQFTKISIKLFFLKSLFFHVLVFL